MRKLRRNSIVMLACLIASFIFIQLFSLPAIYSRADSVQPPADIVETFSSQISSNFNTEGGVRIEDGTAYLEVARLDKVITATAYKYFIFNLEVEVEGSLKISFGENSLNQTNILYNSSELYVNDKYYNLADRELSGIILFDITVFDGSVSVGLRSIENEPAEKLYEIIATQSLPAEHGYSKICITPNIEGSTAYLHSFAVYSLEQSVPTEKEDYDPSHDVPAFDVKPDVNNGTSGSVVLIVILSVCAVIVVVVAVVLIKLIISRKRRKQ